MTISPEIKRAQADYAKAIKRIGVAEATQQLVEAIRETIQSRPHVFSIGERARLDRWCDGIGEVIKWAS